MSQCPDEAEVPTLTLVVRPGTASPAQPESPVPEPSDTPAPALASPTVPRPGPMPEDLDIDLALDGLDGLDMPPHAPAAQSPAPLETLMPPAPATEDGPALRGRIEQLVDEALAARLPQLREQLVRSVLRTLSDGRPGPDGESAGD